MATFKTLESLKLTEHESQSTFTQYGSGGVALADATFQCIRNNPLKRIEIIRMKLPRSLFCQLPASLERLALATVVLDDWDLDPELPVVEIETASLKHLRIEAYAKCFNILSILPTAFFKDLTFLSASITDTKDPFFEFTHRTLIGNARDLQELSIEYPVIDSECESNLFSISLED